MTFGEIIYKILIGPLELFFEVVFQIANRQVSNPAYAIIMLSLAMNILVLPLYRRADAVQAEERDRENALAPWIKHIKKTFKGDERFMMLQAFYRENNYKPTDSLKGSISLLLEIPFFIAAYHFLSNLQTLKGVGFGPISDLGAPDALINIGGMSVNLLPILMTLINVISAAIYMKGFPLKSKIQMYGIAAIFLVFLYKSPAGLVFYWTLNNLFSLFKNIFYKIPNAKTVLFYCALGLTTLLLILVLFVHPMKSARAQVMVVAVLVALTGAIILSRKGFKTGKLLNTKETDVLFTEGSLLLAVLTGALIPTTVIADSPLEFIDASNYTSPLWYFAAAMCLAVGTFIVWFRIFYSLADNSGKNIFTKLMWAGSAICIVDYFFFGKGYGNFSSQLQFDEDIRIPVKEMAINLLAIAAVIAIALLIWKKLPVVKAVYAAACMAIIIMSVINIFGIAQALAPVKSLVAKANESKPEISLSKNGNNVVVLMLDRAASIYVPYIFEEKPELKEQFSGFTYYPNTVTYGTSTNTGAPGLYGGYEYVPAAMNERPELTIPEKNDEALKVMPVLFDESGARVMVVDPTYAGYSWIPDLTIYDDYPEIKTYISEGKFSIDEYSFESFSELTRETRKRNFFCYSLFKAAPLVLQPTLYDHGSYNSSATIETAQNSQGVKAVAQTRTGLSTAEGFEERFMDAYAVLYHLPDITTVADSDQDSFLMMSNNTTHQPTLLQEPEYVPAAVVDNTEFDETHKVRKSWDGEELAFVKDAQVTHYQVNMATFLQLGKWFDYLKEQGVYDNTRIILVSDHSWDLWHKERILLKVDVRGTGNERYFDTTALNCLLMVKDFNADTFTVDNKFMTNADTPYLAMEGEVDDMVNPFTGNEIREVAAGEKGKEVMFTHNWQIDDNQGNTFLPDRWFSVHDNIFNENNWEYLGVY